MKKYYEFCFSPAGESEKAFCLDFYDGYTKSYPEWFPKSQCFVSEENEVGVQIVLIPTWIFCQRRIKPENSRTNYHGVVEWDDIKIRMACWKNNDRNYTYVQ